VTVQWSLRKTTSEFAVKALPCYLPHPHFGLRECRAWRVTLSAAGNERGAHVTGSLLLQEKLAPHSPEWLKSREVGLHKLAGPEPEWLVELVNRCQSELKP
jgi:hypothetical protein